MSLLSLWAAPAQGAGITLSEALELTELTHPSLKAGAARSAAAAALTLTAKAYPNPEFAFLTGHQYSQPPNGKRFNVPVFTFSQPLELGPLRPARRELARRGKESSEYALSEIRLAILSNVRFAFYEVLRRDGEIVIAGESLQLAQDLRDRIRVRVSVGEVGRLELIRADAEVTTARSLAANARIHRVASLAAFRAAVGGELPPDLEPAATLPPPPVLPSLEELKQAVLERHPALALLQSEIRRADARLHYEISLKRPQPEFRVEVDNTNPSYRFGIAVQLPTWNRRVGEVANAEAGVSEAKYSASARRMELLAALESAYGRFQVSNQEVTSLEQGPMREAQEAVHAAQTAYQLGERSIIEVLDAQRVLRTVRLNLLNAQFDRQSAAVEIDELRAYVPGGRP